MAEKKGAGLGAGAGYENVGIPVMVDIGGGEARGCAAESAREQALTCELFDRVGIAGVNKSPFSGGFVIEALRKVCVVLSGGSLGLVCCLLDDKQPIGGGGGVAGFGAVRPADVE